MSSTLLQAEARQAEAFTNRASALFPIFELDQVDLILVFDNYWSWKRSIEVTYSFAIRGEGGELLFKSAPAAPCDINAISIRKVLNLNVVDISRASGGTVEIEIRSDENIQFSFPAILAYYEDKSGGLSVVHSSGRTLEKSSPTSFSEGGFYVSICPDYEPFIHVFNGGFDTISNLTLRLSLFADNCCNEFEFSLPSIASPYQSRIIFLGEYLEVSGIAQLLAAVTAPEVGIAPPRVVAHIVGKCSSIYPRFICGNLLKSSGLPCVAHTFREVTSTSDILDLAAEPGLPRLRLPPLPDPLNLMATVYPYSYPFEIPVEIHEQSDHEVDILTSRSLSVSPEKDIFNYTKYSTVDSSLFVQSAGQNAVVPARISCNLSLFFKGVSSTAFTDIALGFNRASSKNKYTHWFTFLLRPGFSLFLLGASYFLDDPSIEFELSLRLPAIDHISPSAHKHTFNFEGQSFHLPLDLVFATFGLNIDLFMGEACSVVLKMRNTRLDHLICLGYDSGKNSIFAEHSF